MQFASGDRDRRRLAAVCAAALEADAKEAERRCDDLVEAASYWRVAGEPAREHAALVAAMAADDGRGFFDARAAYGEFLMAHGHHAEAEHLFAELLHLHSGREQTYLNAAGAFEEAGQHALALRWLNVGIDQIIGPLSRHSPGTGSPIDLAGGDPGYELLRVRHRLRRRLGWPLDVPDAVFEGLEHRGREISARIRELRRSRS
ncbi:tetratricopeptide repeat protein [Parasphingorhabdus pacifica]